MKLSILRTSGLCVALGIVGCNSPSNSTSVETPEQTAFALTTPNQICADWSPNRRNGDWYCNETQDVEGVYQQARQKAGTQAGTISVFVLWPADEGQEDDPAKIEGWFKQAKLVIDWIKNQKNLSLAERSIESMGDEMKRLSDSQQRLLNKKKGGIADARDAVARMVNKQVDDSEKAALVNALADTKIKLGELAVILQRTNDLLTTLQPDYQLLVDEFKSYRSTEADVTSQLTSFADAASTADIAELARIKVAVTDYERDIDAAPAFERHARQMRAQLVAVQSQYEAAMEPYSDFTAARGLPRPDFVAGALRSTGNMLAYSNSRREATQVALARLVDGLRARTDALIELGASQAIRDNLANARFADAAKGFLDQSNARIAKLWSAVPTSPTLKYPLYSETYDAFSAFEQLEPMCAQATLASSSWMKPGCQAMQPSFDRARSWLANTLPGALRMRLILLRRKNANENLCAEVEAGLAAGNLKSAVSAYDAAVNLLDPGATP